MLPKKVAIIAGQLVVGGAERQLYLWLSHLDRERFNPLVLTLHPGYEDFWEKPIEALGIPLVRIAHHRNRFTRLRKIVEVLRDFQPDLIQGWHLFSSVYAGLAARRLHVKSIGGVRNTYQTFKQHKIESFLMLRTVDAVIANSFSTAAMLGNQHRPARQPVFAIPNAVTWEFLDSTEAQKILTEEYGIPPDSELVGCIARFEPLKRFDLMLEIFSGLLEAKPNAHLVLIGDGAEKQNLEARTAALGISEHVTFTGEIANAGKLLKAFDIFAFPSMDEGMPNVILEAAAAGLPIVTWDLPFYREILTNGENAILVEPGNLEQFGVALQELIDNLDLRLRLGSAARQHVLDTFTIEKYTRNMTQVYDMLLTEKGNPN